MAERDIIEVVFERFKTGKIDKVNVDSRKFRTDNSYKKKVIHSLISELYKQVYQEAYKNKGKEEGG